MTYKINELFYSLQGEGMHSGMPAIFIRFSGCNLKCSFCDTCHEKGVKMTLKEIIKEVEKYPTSLVVLTGGEPSIQADDILIDELHSIGKYVAIETNGTHRLPQKIDWVTLSPKYPFVGEKGKLVIKECDELKYVFTGEELPDFSDIKARHRYLQPCFVEDDKERKQIMKDTVAYCMQHPQWNLSLQVHRILNIR